MVGTVLTMVKTVLTMVGVEQWGPIHPGAPDGRPHEKNKTHFEELLVQSRCHSGSK